MKMDGDYLGGEQRLALEQKLTPYISENREIQIQIAKAVIGPYMTLWEQ